MINQLKIEKTLSEKLNKNTKIFNKTPVLGGDINQTFKLETNSGTFFLKFNNTSLAKEMFKAEVFGLNLLLEHSKFKVPKPLAYSSNYLVLEFLEKGTITKNFWKDFAYNLANLHKTTNEKFGLKQNNFIGTLNQPNNRADTWEEFFVTQRLEPQLKLSIENNNADKTLIQKFEKLYSKLEDLFPKEPAALLHGDLWSGNYFATKNGTPAIFDPAVYFGHREMDIAMTKLFGGFSNDLYYHYNTIFPLENGWEERIHICNLYPLLVHVNLFGGHYVNSVSSILNKFV